MKQFTQAQNNTGGSVLVATILGFIVLCFMLVGQWLFKAFCFLAPILGRLAYRAMRPVVGKAIQHFRVRFARAAACYTSKKVTYVTPEIFQGSANLAPAKDFNLRTIDRT